MRHKLKLEQYDDEEYYEQYGDYGDYGEEQKYEEKKIVQESNEEEGITLDEYKLKKKISEKEDKDLQRAIQESKMIFEKEQEQQIGQLKKKKSKKEAPDQIIVESIFNEFNNYFSKQQVIDTLIANQNDIDKTMVSLKLRKQKDDARGKGNIKNEIQKKIEKQIEEEKKKQEEEEKKGTNQKKNNQKEKEKEKEKQKESEQIIEKVLDHETLNLDYPTVTYNIELDQENLKREINMVIIGHVDAGKSTLMGHLLFKLGIIDKQQMHKNTKISQQYGKESFKFAYILDEDDEERRRGITINTAQAFFRTKNKDFTIIDAPGHRDFISNMIRGASQAECAILVIDGSGHGFESGFENGSTKDHAIIARSLGVTQICVTINKLDMIGWDEKRYDYICDKVYPFLKQAGYAEKNIYFVPISGLSGDNLDSRDSQPEQLRSWYNDKNGKENIFKAPNCLIDILDQFKSFPKQIDKPARACIYDYYNKVKDGFSITSGDCVQAKIQSGIIKVKDKLLMIPQDIEVIVKSIECQKESAEFVHSGQICEIQIQIPKDFDPQFIKPGSVMCDPQYPVHQVKKFKARVVVFDVKIPITKGQDIVVFAFSNKSSGKIISLDQTINQKTQQTIKNKPKILVKGDLADITIKMNQKICLELFKNNKSMGRIALRDGEETIAAGFISEFFY